jgi:SGF29 tudor-like domain
MIFILPDLLPRDFHIYCQCCSFPGENLDLTRKIYQTMSSIPSAPGSDVTTTSTGANADHRQMQGLPQHTPGSMERGAMSPIFPPPSNRAASNSLSEGQASSYVVDYNNSSKNSPISTYGNSNYPLPNAPLAQGMSGRDVERQRYMMQTATAAASSSSYHSTANPVRNNNSSGITDPASNSSPATSPSRPQMIGQPIPSPQQMLQMKQQQQLRQMKLQQLQRSQQYQKQQGQLSQQGADSTSETMGSSCVSPQKYDFSNAPPHFSQRSSGESNFDQRSLNGSSTAQVQNSSSNSQNPYQINASQAPVASARFQPPQGQQPRNVMTSHPAGILTEIMSPPISTEASTSISLSSTKADALLATSKAKQLSSGNLSAKSNSNAGSMTGGASGMSASPATLPTEQVMSLLSRCNWIDKTVWASRQLLGGQSVNGFMRATATVQRIKKQRARQNVRSGKKSSTTAGIAAPGGDPGNSSTSASANLSLEEQQAEEDVLKKDVMNARTAKKIKQELDAGIQFCVVLHDTIRSIILHMDPSLPPVDPLSSSPMSRNPSRAGISVSSASLTSHPQLTQNGASGMSKSGNSKKPVSSPSAAMPIVKPPAAPPRSPLHTNQDKLGLSSQTSPSNSTGSTLRRYRKTKIPPSGESLIQLPEVDELTGKRHSTKKDHPHRLSDVIRYRALRQGDPVAARVTSRDLWILACVVKDYPGINMTPLELVRLSDARREQLFKEKVLIQDVEERDGGTTAAVLVSRSLVLPLPRSIAEAAEWGNYYRFFKKGSRVYAMYPNTTALYTATVVDCTTYCLGDEDVIVVEFDGDEPDAVSGKIPACHIPARFVTLIPKEFPGAQDPSSSTNKRKRSSPIAPSMDVDIMNGVLDDLNFDGDLPGLDQLDDLDFDLLGDS